MVFFKTKKVYTEFIQIAIAMNYVYNIYQHNLVILGRAFLSFLDKQRWIMLIAIFIAVLVLLSFQITDQLCLPLSV